MEENRIYIDEQKDSTLNQSSENLAQHSRDDLVLDNEGKETIRTMVIWMQVFSIVCIVHIGMIILSMISSSYNAFYFIILGIFFFANLICLQGAKSYKNSYLSNDKEEFKNGLNSTKLFFIINAILLIFLFLFNVYMIIQTSHSVIKGS